MRVPQIFRLSKSPTPCLSNTGASLGAYGEMEARLSIIVTNVMRCTSGGVIRVVHDLIAIVSERH